MLIGEKFEIGPEEADKKFNYIRTSCGRWLKKFPLALEEI